MIFAAEYAVLVDPYGRIIFKTNHSWNWQEERTHQDYPNEEKIHNLLDIAIQEVDFPTYFQIDKLASAAKTSPPKLNVLIEKLRNCGFLTSKTILDTQGLKTNARVGEIIKLIK